MRSFLFGILCVALLSFEAACNRGRDASAAAKRIDPATIAAYEKLGGEYGGWWKPSTFPYFEAGREAAEGGIPGFRFKQLPEGPLPEVAVPFGLGLYNLPGVNGRLADVARLKNLTLLDLGGTDVASADMKTLAELKQLSTLFLAATGVGDGGLKELAKFPNLTALDLWNKEITDEGLKELAGMEKLSCLALPEKATYKGVKNLVPLKNLTSLNITHTRVDGLGLLELGPFKKLTRLAMEPKYVLDSTLHILRAQGQLHALSLATGENDSRPTTAEEVTALDLGATPVGDNGLPALAHLTNLTKLVLGNLSVTNDGLKHLAVFKKLTTLDVRSAYVTDRGLKELARLETLTTLNLQGTMTTGEGIAELRKALPKCAITGP